MLVEWPESCGDSPSLPQAPKDVPETLSFKDKMKMFADTGDGTPKEKAKSSRAQRLID